MNRYRTLAANVALISIGTFGSKVLVFLMVWFYTEWLSPAEYSTADLLTQTANLLLPLATLGVSDAVFRFAIDRAGARARVFTIGFWMVTAGSIGLGSLLLLFEWLRPGGDALWLLWAFVAASGYLILGLMAGSLFAIVMGPTTLADARPALGLSTFSLAGFLAGVVVFIGLEFLKRYFEQQGRCQLKGAGRRGH